MKSGLFFLSFFLLFQQTSFSQPLMDTLRIKFVGKEYDKIGMRMDLEYGKYVYFKGVSEDQVNWMFIYPDSVYERSAHFELFTSLPDRTTRSICARIVENGRTTCPGAIGAVRNVSYVFNYYIPKMIDGKLSNKDDEFIVENFKPEQYGALYHGYCFFNFRTGDKTLTSYEEVVERYVELTQKYPDNHSFMALLASNMGVFNSKEEVKRVYDCFSDARKDSYFGRKVRAYLEGGYFHNSTLYDAQTGVSGLLVQDSTKYNLIVFSASWCQPCHKLIPILKQMHNDLKERLIITYVSIDEVKTIDKWRELMAKEQIPWRSLLAADCLVSIKDRYLVQSIPRVVLVYPDRKMKWIDIRKGEDKEMVYQLIGTHK